jgi:hypothetical protein
MREAKRDKGMYHSSLRDRSVCLGAARVEHNVDLLSVSLSLSLSSFSLFFIQTFIFSAQEQQRIGGLRKRRTEAWNKQSIDLLCRD